MILRLYLNIILISGDICKSRTDPGDIIQTVLRNCGLLSPMATPHTRPFVSPDRRECLNRLSSHRCTSYRWQIHR